MFFIQTSHNNIKTNPFEMLQAKTMVYLNEWRLNSRAILKFQRFQSKIIQKAQQKYDIFDKKLNSKSPIS